MGRQMSRRAGGGPPASRLAVASGLAADEHVARLDVAMHDPAGVRRVDRRGCKRLPVKTLPKVEVARELRRDEFQCELTMNA